MWYFVIEEYCDHQYLPVLPHSFPTRRSSDLHRRRTRSNRRIAEPLGDRGGEGIAQPHRRQPVTRPTGNGGGRRRVAARGMAQRHQSRDRSEEHTSELQSLMRISYAVFCLKKKTTNHQLLLIYY